MSSVDYLIIGAGPAGVCAANILAKTGKKTVIVSKNLGGTFCFDGRVVLNSLLHISSLYDKHKQAMQFFSDVPTSPAKIDFKKVKKYVDSASMRICKAFSSEMEDNGVEFIEGQAQFSDKNKITITKSDDSKLELTFKKCILATGSVPKKLDILSGAKSFKISTILNYETVPASVVIIGGGLVGTEAATFFSRLGSKVTILEKSERILKGVDQVIIKKYEDVLKKKDIDIVTNVNIDRIERIGQKYVILYNDTKVESEEVFLCIGRTPYIDNLNLEVAGITLNDGIPNYNPDLTTDNKDIYLAGDITGLRMYSGWAFHSAEIAAKNILGSNLKYTSSVASTILSADPEIACIGINEEEAKKTGYNYGIIKYNFGDIHKSAMPSASPLFTKVIWDKETKKFLGMQAIGQMAIDIVSDFSIMIQAGITIDKASNYIYTSPIFYELISELMEKIK